MLCFLAILCSYRFPKYFTTCVASRMAWIDCYNSLWSLTFPNPSLEVLDIEEIREVIYLGYPTCWGISLCLLLSAEWLTVPQFADFWLGYVSSAINCWDQGCDTFNLLQWPTLQPRFYIVKSILVRLPICWGLQRRLEQLYYPGEYLAHCVLALCIALHHPSNSKYQTLCGLRPCDSLDQCTKFSHFHSFRVLTHAHQKGGKYGVGILYYLFYTLWRHQSKPVFSICRIIYQQAQSFSRNAL